MIKKTELEYIHDMLAALDGRLDDIEKSLIKQEINLAEHMRRTALLEEEIKPLKHDNSMVKGAIALLGLIALIAGIVGALR